MQIQVSSVSQVTQSTCIRLFPSRCYFSAGVTFVFHCFWARQQEVLMNLYYPDIWYHRNLVFSYWKKKLFQKVLPEPKQFPRLLQTKQNFYSFSHHRTLPLLLKAFWLLLVFLIICPVIKKTPKRECALLFVPNICHQN